MKYLIIGGANGLGLAIANQLSKDNNSKIIIYDIKSPQIIKDNIEYKKIDLINDDLSMMQNDINNVDSLIYTAGIGRVDFFENYSFNEIDANITINLTSLIKVISMASKKLLENDFKVMCISSIAGLVSSPLFSVYSASKAGVCKYIEAVNTELKKIGSPNVITNVVATAFKGTSFNGGTTKLDELEELSLELINAMNNKEEIHKVNKELVDSILHRYNDDANKFSLESFDYKMKSGRISKNHK